MKGRIKREDEPDVPVNEIGKIHVGYQDEKGYPHGVDYFIATGDYADRFHEVYGEKPTRIPITFLSDDLEAVCNERWEIRTKKSYDGIGGRLFAEGDGDDFRVYDRKKDKFIDTTKQVFPDIFEKCVKECGGEWKVTLTLRFMIFGLPGILGYWTLNTKGEKSSINNIRRPFDAVKEGLKTVRMVKFDLSVKWAKTQKPFDKSKFPVISLTPIISKETMHRVSNILEDKKMDLIEFLHEKKMLYIADDVPQLEEATDNKIIDADFSMEKQANNESYFCKAERLYQECKSIEDLNRAVNLSNNIKFSKEESHKLALLRQEAAKRITGGMHG